MKLFFMERKMTPSIVYCRTAAKSCSVRFQSRFEQKTNWMSYNRWLNFPINVNSLSDNMILWTGLHSTLQIVTTTGERFNVCLKAETITSGITLKSEAPNHQCEKLQVKKFTLDESISYKIDKNWNLLAMINEGENLLKPQLFHTQPYLLRPWCSPCYQKQ